MTAAAPSMMVSFPITRRPETDLTHGLFHALTTQSAVLDIAVALG